MTDRVTLRYIFGNQRIRVYHVVGGTLTRLGQTKQTWDPGSSFTIPATFWVEGVEPSQALYDVNMTLIHEHPAGAWGESCEDWLRWTVVGVDLDVDSDNDGTIDPDNSSAGTDDKIEADANLPGKILAVNNDFDEDALLPDNVDPSPVHADGSAIVLDDMVLCNAEIFPKNDPDPVITLTSSSSLVRVLAINPNAAHPFVQGDDWEVVPFDQNLAEDYFTQSGDYFGWQWWIEGLAPGVETLTFKYEGHNLTIEDKVQLTVVRVRPQYVTFSGTDMCNVVPDDGGNPYPTPHWKDNSQPPDYDNNDVGDHNFPVVYPRGTRMQVEARFSIEQPDALGTSVKVIGKTTVSGTTYTFTDTASVISGIVTTAPMAADHVLADRVDYFDPLEIKWSLSRVGGPTLDYDIPTTKHRVYVTLGPPNPGSLYDTVLNVACRNAIGKITNQEVVAGIYTEFKTRDVRRKQFNGFNESDNAQMRYWVNIGDPRLQAVEADCQTLTALLDPSPPDPALNGIGTCHAWASLLQATFGAHGISSSIVEVESLRRNDSGLSFDGITDRGAILVKSWNFAAQGTAHGGCAPFTHINSEIQDIAGTPGQGATTNPPAAFLNHYIVAYGTAYFDPSYGTNDADTLTQSDWEQASLDGYRKLCAQAGNASVNMQETANVDTVFTP